MAVEILEENRSLTPAEYARLRGVGVGKVMVWITSGALRATNMATVVGRSPRWRIHPADILVFEAARSNAPALAPQRRRRQESDVIEYV